MKKNNKTAGRLILILIIILLITTLISTHIHIDFSVNFEVDDEVAYIVPTKGGETITLPDDPPKVGYSFDGWFFDKDTWENQVTNNSFLQTILKENVSVYAKWVINSYTITVNKNMDSAGTVIGEGSKEYNSSVTLVAETNTGYIWVGWFDGEAKVSADKSYTFTMPAENKALEARWAAKAYNITYELNGGINNELNPATYTPEDTFALLPATKQGYSFLGWYIYLNNEDRTPISEIEAGWTGDITIYAEWGINNYLVTLNMNKDNAGTVSGGGEKEYNSSVTITATTNEEVYIWIGWFDGDTKVCNDESYTFDMPAEDKVYEARWTARAYNITYELYGGENNEGNPATYTVEDVLTLLAPTKEGHNFLGWYIRLGQEAALPIPEIGDITVFAEWAPKSYLVTLSKNVNAEDMLYDAGTVSGGGIKVYNSSVTITATTYGEEYTWIGWFDGDTKVCDNEVYTFNMPATDKAYEARWAATVYNIIYQLDGGENNEGNPLTYTVESEDILLLAPTKEGHDFLYWYLYYGSGGEIVTTEIILEHGWAWDITIFAKWKINSYLVTLSSNNDYAGGVVGGGEKVYNSSVTIYAYPEEGYTFIGWFDGEIKVCDDEAYTFNMPAENKVYEARWTATILIITYDLFGGINHIDNPQTCTVEESFVLQPPTREGYNFVRWYLDVGWGAGIPVTEGQELSFTRDIRIYAEWSPISYDITYNLNGGYNHINNPAKYTIEDAFILQDPEKEGYDFVGWYKDEDFEIEFLGIELGSMGDIAVYAEWTPTIYTITYELYGGENNEGNPDTYTVEGTDIILLPPSKEGYDFVYWYFYLGQGADYIIEIINLEEELWTSDLTIHAKWSPIAYNITYNLNGGYNHINNPAKYTIEDAFTLQDPQKEGYTFAGWYKDADFAVEFLGIEAGTMGDIVVYAEWTINKYTILFVTNGGSPVDSITQDYNSVVIKPADPTKEGYTFDDWYTDNITFSNVYTFSTMPLDGITLYANWIINKYTISFVTNGGSPVEGITQDYNSVVTKPEDPSMLGYTFDDWYTDNTTFNNVYTFSTMPLGGITLYANWQIDTYIVTASKNIDSAGTVTGDGSKEYNSSVMLTAETNIGYTWLGWFDGDNKVCDGKIYTFDMPAEDKTYEARWEAISGTVSFNANGGLGEMSVAELSTGDSLPSNEFIKMSFYFIGWSLSAVGEVVYADNDVITIENSGEEIVLYAIWTSYQRVNAAGEPTAEGEYILFGEYPQTIKADSVTVGSTPDARGYYLGSDGYYYAEVTVNQYPFGGDYNFSNGELVIDDIVHYFKVEPIKWRILEESGGTALILCENILANKKHHSLFSGVDEDGHYVNSYIISEIRAWLNDEFYNTAFNELQRQLVLVTYLDNSASSTGYDPNQYACDDIEDLIFLPSYADIINTNYGFNGNADREKLTSDYSRATGVSMDTGYYYGNGSWWLRSPNNSLAHIMSIIDKNGNISMTSVSGSFFGIAPALTIQLSGNKVIFDTNGGSIINPIVVPDGENLSPPPSPEKEGYTFDSWYLDDVTFEEEYDFDSIVTESFTLYANWAAIEYDITYNLNGGTNHTSNPSTYTIEDSITLQEPTQDGYNFVGWFSDASLGVVFTGITAGTTGNVTVYAKWQKAGPIAPEGHIYFGEYPQTQKASSVTIIASQDSRGYYLGDDDSYYALLNGKYYKVEPILWKILKDDNGELFIHSTIALQARRFDASSSSYGTSEVRDWLLGEFLNVAFTFEEQSYMKAYNSSDGIVNGDKVFLLSKAEVEDAALGFTDNTSRIRIITDYSKETGAAYSGNNCRWWLRTPTATGYANRVDTDGKVVTYNVDGLVNSIIPALKIKLS